jgi:hypothetical protein
MRVNKMGIMNKSLNQQCLALLSVTFNALADFLILGVIISYGENRLCHGTPPIRYNPTAANLLVRLKLPSRMGELNAMGDSLTHD